MNSTTPADGLMRCAAVVLLCTVSLMGHASSTPEVPMGAASQQAAPETISAKQQALVPIAAFGAAGNLPQLNAALSRGLDAGLPVNEIKEILV